MIYLILAIALGLFIFSTYKVLHQRRHRHMLPSRPRH
ncbi:response regulator [Pantoea sp. GD03673]|nr:response regulator [Pantoea sp. GD03673]MDH2066477.1 response regulator [Pantoea sp. GD03673]